MRAREGTPGTLRGKKKRLPYSKIFSKRLPRHRPFLYHGKGRVRSSKGFAMTTFNDPARAAEPSNRSRRFQVRDFLRTEGVTVASPHDQLSPDDTLIYGNFLHAELRPGLVLHCSDVLEERAFTATSVLREGLSCIFFLDGNVDLQIGDRSYAFAGPRGAVTGATIMNARPERFQRSSRRRQHLRHLVVSASPEWLDLDGMQNVHEPSRGREFLKDHLTDHRWELTPRAIELVQQVLAPSPLMPQLHNLYLEGRAVELVAESLAAAMRADRAINDGTILTRPERIRLQRAIDIILANLEAPLSVDMIARKAGTSASGLQKLFHQAEGKSIFEYVRGERLARACDALKSGEATIKEASVLAGYTSPANFATAFRKRFGTTPRRVAKR